MCLSFIKVTVKRVAVIELGIYSESGDGIGCIEFKVVDDSIRYAISIY